MIAFNHTPLERKSPWNLAAHTGSDSVRDLISLYATERGLQDAIGRVFPSLQVSSTGLSCNLKGGHPNDRR